MNKQNHLSSRVTSLLAGLLMLFVSAVVLAVEPVAVISGSYTGLAGDKIQIDGSASYDPDGAITQYWWEWGDDTLRGVGPLYSQPKHIYTEAGTYTVSLTVTDDEGLTHTTSTTVNIQASVPPVASLAGPLTVAVGERVIIDGTGSSDTDGAITEYWWEWGDGTRRGVGPNYDRGVHTYTEAGVYVVSLRVTDDDGLTDTATTSVVVGATQLPSTNSTSHNDFPFTGVSEMAIAGNTDYKLFGTNDLGMHCGDFDTRISSILPPFNVMHAQVIQRGPMPEILTPEDGVSVYYSAASNPNDPVLTGINSAGSGPVMSSMTNEGKVYKTNFWDTVPGGTESTALAAYRAFYPPGILDLFTPETDKSLPMPNVEVLYFQGALTAETQDMPGRANPYVDNTPQNFMLFTLDQPFFINFPFGYTATAVDWYEAAGIPLTAFDDQGRENPWPLYRVQATNSAGDVIASTDVVVPISGEANCGACHNAEVDGGNGAATHMLDSVATVLDDPEFDVSVPLAVSLEYAADINIVRLHDQKHGTDLENSTPVVCQSCHYTPALDLAHVGPKGEGDADANGRMQTNVRSMSNVMHSHHGSVTDQAGNKLFPEMPPAVDADGNLRDPMLAREVLNETCYQCHPGRRTDCLRGAMANGGMLCQDCHGNMDQVGNDFTGDVTPDNPGAFVLGGNFYDHNDPQPRVPWANEPGCGSCHTGDAMNNMHGDADTMGDPEDGIRLMQAYRIGDPKATPIVPSNKRFAENTIPDTSELHDGSTVTNNGAGNPMLYRVSKGHEGIFCEACHGATHGIWPNKNPGANDNVAAIQLQGHAGMISECSTCHTGDLGNTLEGPHGMHPIGEAGVRFANGGHGSVAERNPNACRACHGRNGEGTALSKMKADRVLRCDNRTAFCPSGNSQLFPEGYEVTCTDCHGNEL